MQPTTDFRNTPPENTSIWQRYATTWKGLVIFGVMLVLLIPASMVEGLIWERQNRRDQAILEVSSKWGGNQTISGPVLVVPYEVSERNEEGKEVGRKREYAYFLPESLKIDGQATPEMRHRGIFDVVLYNSQLSLQGTFARPQVSEIMPQGADVLWSKAVLALGIPDLRGLNDQVNLQWNGESYVLEPGIPVPGVEESGIHLPLDLTAANIATYTFSVAISLKGSGSLFFTPVGRITDVALSAPWGNPSFTGAFLPDDKNITASSFEAKWRVLNLNRNYPQQWTSDQNVTFSGSAFGVDFLLPVDNYQKATRSAKYAILFISLTFLTVFFIEMRQARRRVHPFQYMLIGLALVIFYTLLVSLSEHLTYNTAYFIAAAMTIGLATYYARSLFDSNALALLVGGTLTVLYGFLFVVLQQQDYALLIGSFGLFFILAAVMYVSKKINWEQDK